MKNIKNKINSVFLIALSFVFAPLSLAAGPHLVPDNCRASGDCQLNDFVLVAVNISKWILILSGSMSLLAFVVGGLMMILSGGNKDMVQKGKNAIIGAVIGIVIVLLAYTIIDFALKQMGYQSNGPWYETPTI